MKLSSIPRNVFIKFVQFLSPAVLGVLIGIITGLVINLLTDSSLLTQNYRSVWLFSFSIIPLLVLVHIRDELQFTYLQKLSAGGNSKISWNSTLSKSFTKRDWKFICVFVVFFALIFFGIKCMKKPEPCITTTSAPVIAKLSLRK
jgi:hypothetical protein